MNTGNLKDKYDAEFKEFLLSKLTNAKQEVIEIEALINGLGHTNGISKSVSPQLIMPEINTITSLDGYKTNWTWKQKIVHFLSKEPLITSEIVEKILISEPALSSQRSKVVASVSAVLSAQSKKDTDIFGKTLNDRGANIYSINNKNA